MTDAHTAESLTRYHVRPGDLLLADGGFARVRDLCRVRERGASVVVRLNAHAVVARTPDGERIDWVALLRDQAPDSLQTIRVRLCTADGAHEVGGWVHAYRMTDEGRRFPGVTENLRWAVGLPPRDARMIVA